MGIATIGPKDQPIKDVGIQFTDKRKIGPIGKLKICVIKRNEIKDANNAIKWVEYLHLTGK